MGKMAMQLNRIFDNALRAKIISLEAFIKAKQQAEQNLPRLPSAEQLIADGGDPMHALYVNTLNLIVLFGETVTTLTPLHPIHDLLTKWMDIYQPSLPPMSPITMSFFNTWIMLDGAFGKDRETVSTCLLSVIDRLRLNPEQVQLIRNLDQSRMGIYEVLTSKGQFFELRELVTNKHLTAHICSGYQGNPGEIIFIRLVPPLDQTVNYSVGMTTPYLLLRKNEQEWLNYFERHDIYPKTVGVDVRLHNHMKYGKNKTYWSEFIFYGYTNYQPGVIWLEGFPDQAETQPQHDKYIGRL